MIALKFIFDQFFKLLLKNKNFLREPYCYYDTRQDCSNCEIYLLQKNIPGIA
jgi:hypothetical protein